MFYQQKMSFCAASGLMLVIICNSEKARAPEVFTNIKIHTNGTRLNIKSCLIDSPQANHNIQFIYIFLLR